MKKDEEKFTKLWNFIEISIIKKIINQSLKMFAQN